MNSAEWVGLLLYPESGDKMHIGFFKMKSSSLNYFIVRLISIVLPKCSGSLLGNLIFKRSCIHNTVN